MRGGTTSSSVRLQDFAGRIFNAIVVALGPIGKENVRYNDLLFRAYGGNAEATGEGIEPQLAIVRLRGRSHGTWNLKVLNLIGGRFNYDDATEELSILRGCLPS